MVVIGVLAEDYDFDGVEGGVARPIVQCQLPGRDVCINMLTSCIPRLKVGRSSSLLLPHA